MESIRGSRSKSQVTLTIHTSRSAFTKFTRKGIATYYKQICYYIYRLLNQFFLSILFSWFYTGRVTSSSEGEALLWTCW